MYIPSAFAETDQERLHAFIEAHSFGLLVSARDGVPFASHLPFLLERGTGPHGRLVGHLARANPHWHGLDGHEVLAVFSGPHAYVSPSWYGEPDVVPTWNYVAVHAYGIPRLVDDPAALTQILKSTVNTYETARPAPWTLDTATPYFQKMARAVVGFTIDLTRLEGKWKLSQNHPRERQEKVAAALWASLDPDAKAVARLMDDRLARGRPQ